MSEKLTLVRDLAVILISAGVFTVLSKVLKQPSILGYIIAGFLVGPKFGFFPTVSSIEAVDQWSEIGIIFLLFALGLDFSFKKLLSVGSSALIMAGTKCLGMFLFGFTIGNTLGWSMMECIFLGGLLGMSSTTIIIKSYNDMGLSNKPHASLIFGELVVEDLIAVLMMVLLSTLAVSQNFSGSEMVFCLLKLVFFLILWFLVGIFVLPTLMKKAHKYMNDEIMLIVAIGLCFGMVTLATFVGFSSALGAFVMGSLLCETIEGKRIERLMVSIKDLFGAIFFVSVGMMIDPAIIAQNWPVILIITAVAMGGVLIWSTTGAMLAGKGMNTALHCSFTLAQLGEFGFIIASLGCSLGVMREFIYPVIISVSVLTTFTTPYMIKAADPVVDFLRRKLPKKVLDRIDHEPYTVKVKSKAEKNVWKDYLKQYAIRVVVYSVLIIAILGLSHSYLKPLLNKFGQDLSPTVLKIIGTLITLFLVGPFISGLTFVKGSLESMGNTLLKEKPSNRWPLFALSVLRVLLGVVFLMGSLMIVFDNGLWTCIICGALLVLAYFMSTRIYGKNLFLEKHFFHNLNEKEELEKKAMPVTTSVNKRFAGYDVHPQSVTVPQDFKFIGRQLKEMPFRKDSGVNIIKIRRGSKNIIIPSGDEIIYPGDVLLAVGTKEQLVRFSEIIKENTVEINEDDPDFSIDSFEVNADSIVNGKSLRELDMRKSGCMVLCIEHDGKRLTNPKPDFVCSPGDLVWIAGETASCQWFTK